MKKIKLTKYFLAAILAFSITSCHDDLDLMPNDPDMITENDVFANATQAKSALAKVYATLAITGQEGPAGDGDIQGVDEGGSQFTRSLFTLNVITTDEAIVGWGDAGLPNMHGLNWGSDNNFIGGMYYRLAATVSYANSFIKNAEGLAANDPEVKEYIAEARFIRAYAYYNLMDLFANVPLVTEISSALPTQSNRQEIFTFVESELLDIQNQLKQEKNEYGRVDKVAAYALLSRLYLNAETWINQNKYTESVTYSKLAINSFYTLHTTDVNGNGTAYDELFLADNDSNGAQNEFIFALNFDGNNSKTYGGSTFLVKGSIGGDMLPAEWGVNDKWGGQRSTKALVSKFQSNQNDSNGNPIGWADKRAKFYTTDHTYEINSVSDFSNGYAVVKFSNKKSDGTNGNDATGQYADTDIPVIRVAEIYLNYAEAVLRGGAGGDLNTALTYINALRTRGYGNASGNVTLADLNLNFILDERSRELYWEGTRRTDLIRFNKFVSGYDWPFKGNVAGGTSVSDIRKIFPIPLNIITINPNLTQNPGY